MSRSVERFVLGTIATIAGVICRIIFDGIFFRIFYEESYIEMVVVIILLMTILLGMVLMSKIMPMILRIVGAAFLGIGVGGAAIDAIISVLLMCNVSTKTINVLQYICFLALFIASGMLGARKATE